MANVGCRRWLKGITVRLGAALLGAMMWLPTANALPAASIDVVSGEIAFRSTRKGSVSDVRIRFRNASDVGVEALKVRTVFSGQPIKRVKEGDWRYRTVTLDLPVLPGQEGVAEFTETGTALHSRIEIVEAIPALRVAMNGEIKALARSPFLWEDTSFGPLGEIGRRMGFEPTWDEPFQLAGLYSEEHAMVLQPGSRHVVLDGTPAKLRRGIRLVDGALIGPIAEVFGLLGAEVGYDPKNNVVEVTYPPSVAERTE